MKKVGRQSIDPEIVSKEAALLKEIWDNTPREIRGNQAEFGEKYQIGTQAAVGFFLNGKSTISPKAARGFAAGLGCSIADFSPRLAKEAELNAKFTHSERLSVNGLLAELAPALENVPDDVKLAIKRIVQAYQADPVDGENKAKAIIALLGPGPN